MRVLRQALRAVVSVVAALLLGQATGAEPQLRRDVGGDRFAMGRAVDVDSAVGGDLFAAGADVRVTARVDGDALIAGGDVRVGSRVAGSIFALAGELGIDGSIARNARIAGGNVELGQASEVGGNVSVAGGNVRLSGRIGGYVDAAAGQLVIDGTVDGDVDCRAEEVELGSHARIGGRLRYASGVPLKRHPDAQVAGTIERIESEEGWSVGAAAEHSVDDRAGWIWTIGLVLLTVVLTAAMPASSARLAAALREHPGMSLLIGFASLVMIPAAAIVLMLTVVGIPLALLALLLYPVLLVVGYAATAIGIGLSALERIDAEHADRAGWRVCAAGVAMLVLALLGRVPWLGTLVVLVALIAGVGVVALQLWRSARRETRRAEAAPTAR